MSGILKTYLKLRSIWVEFGDRIIATQHSGEKIPGYRPYSRHARKVRFCCYGAPGSKCKRNFCRVGDHLWGKIPGWRNEVRRTLYISEHFRCIKMYIKTLAYPVLFFSSSVLFVLRLCSGYSVLSVLFFFFFLTRVSFSEFFAVRFTLGTSISRILDNGNI